MKKFSVKVRMSMYVEVELSDDTKLKDFKDATSSASRAVIDEAWQNAGLLEGLKWHFPFAKVTAIK